MKKHKIKDKFLAELRRIPIVEVACEKVGISRVSVYKWRNADKEFAKDMAEALAEGEALINDISESQLLTLIKEKNWNALSFWLRHRNPKFRDKVEITTKVVNDGKLSPEQEATIKEALRLASLTAPEQKLENVDNNKKINSDNQKNHE